MLLSRGFRGVSLLVAFGFSGVVGGSRRWGVAGDVSLSFDGLKSEWMLMMRCRQLCIGTALTVFFLP